MIALLFAPAASSAGAQTARVSPAVLEARVDGFASRSAGVQGGVGVAFDAGPYVRLAAIGGAGVERRPGGAVTGVQRIEGVARFFVDPYRRSPRGVYAAGGLAVRHVAGDPLRPVIVALLGVELRPHGVVVPAVEGGVGGGARLAVVLRQARRARR